MHTERAIQIASTDIPLNEDGLVSERQRDVLRKQHLLYLAGSAAFVALLMLLSIGIAIKITHPPFGARGPFWLAGVIAVFWLMLLGRACLQYTRTRRDLREGRVESVAGVVVHHLSSTPGLIHFLRYSIRCGDRRFSVPQDVFFQFQNGHSYRIYYARYSGIFLGAVPCFPGTASSGSAGRVVDDRPDDLQPPLPDLAPTDREPLLPREHEVLELIAAGLSNQEIADRLFLSIHTVKMYASQLYRKLGVRRRTEAVRRARHMGLLPPL